MPPVAITQKTRSSREIQKIPWGYDPSQDPEEVIAEGNKCTKEKGMQHEPSFPRDLAAHTHLVSARIVRTI